VLSGVVLGYWAGMSSAQEPKSDEKPHPTPRVRLKLPAGTTAPSTNSPQPTAAPSPSFEIPDGTPIHMRLAQSVRGITRSLVKIKVYSREGDAVRMVASEDVRVNGLVVIPKGAEGQATVTSVPLPGLTTGGNFQKGAAIELFIPKTGTVSLELDWVRDITGEKVPLRAIPLGESKPFVVSVWADQGGMVVYPAKPKRDLQSLIHGHLRIWAPTGARLTAFVDGATGVDPEELKQSQQLLPIPNENDILTIYRTKGQAAKEVRIFCDQKEVAKLGQWQYVALEVTPGKHRCQVDGQVPLEFEAKGGQEIFLHVRRKSADVWELLPVDVGEGEDATARGEVVAEDGGSEAQQ